MVSCNSRSDGGGGVGDGEVGTHQQHLQRQRLDRDSSSQQRTATATGCGRFYSISSPPPSTPPISCTPPPLSRYCLHPVNRLPKQRWCCRTRTNEHTYTAQLCADIHTHAHWRPELLGKPSVRDLDWPNNVEESRLSAVYCAVRDRTAPYTHNKWKARNPPLHVYFCDNLYAIRIIDKIRYTLFRF